MQHDIAAQIAHKPGHGVGANPTSGQSRGLSYHTAQPFISSGHAQSGCLFPEVTYVMDEASSRFHVLRRATDCRITGISMLYAASS